MDETNALHRVISRLLCRLGIHGPDWFGHGPRNSTHRNYSVGPGHRRCTRCGTEWVAYEAASKRPVRVLAWEKIKGVHQ